MKPVQCPFCGSRKITAEMVEWEARSLEPTDASNNAVLDENQCRDCGRSFWT